MIRVVLDTNVVVSALLTPDGNERRVLRLVLDATRLTLLLSPPIRDEYADVLPRPRFKLTPREIDEALRRLEAVAEWVHPRVAVKAATDPEDNRFLECAEAGEAAYLVTGNTRHFPARWKQTRVVTARELLQLIVPLRDP